MSSLPISRIQSSGTATRLGLRTLVAPVLLPMAVLGLAANLLLFTSPLYMMQVYDRVLSSRSETTLLALSVIVAFLLALLGGFEFFRSRILVRMGLRFNEELSPRLFDAAMRAERKSPRSGSGQFLRDADIVREFMSGPALVILFDAPMAPLFVALAWLLHPWLGVAALGGAIVLFSLAVASEASTRRLVNEGGHKAAVAMAEAGFSLQNAEAVRALGMQAAVRQRWLSGREAMLAAQTSANDRAGTLLSASKFARYLLQSAILGLGAWLAIYQEISPGMMIAASILMGRALAPVEQAVANWKGFLAARAAYSRLTKLLQEDTPEAALPGLPDPRGHLMVDNVTVRPPKASRQTLRDVTFEVCGGECVAVVGPSASGKSTLVRAAAGLWPVESGSLRMDGYTLDQWHPDVLGRHLGYVPQDIDLFPGTVADNIARLGEVDMDAVIKAATAAGLHEAIQRFPDGYGTRVGPGGLPLSGGQRQRIALARALYGQPPLLVLDEPNSNLDAAGEQALMAAIREAKALGQAVLLTTHKPSLLQVADRILVLADGAVHAYGPREQVMPGLMGKRPPHHAVEGDNDDAKRAAG